MFRIKNGSNAAIKWSAKATRPAYMLLFLKIGLAESVKRAYNVFRCISKAF